jgi:hypothetical protein
MTNPTVRIHDIATNEIIDKVMSDEEYADYSAQIAAQIAANTEAEKQAETKANDKIALLERLGLTEEELKTILG